MRKLAVVGTVALGSTILIDPATALGRKKRGRKSRGAGDNQDGSEATSDAGRSGQENSANAAAADDAGDSNGGEGGGGTGGAGGDATGGNAGSANGGAGAGGAGGPASAGSVNGGNANGGAGPMPMVALAAGQPQAMRLAPTVVLGATPVVPMVPVGRTSAARAVSVGPIRPDRPLQEPVAVRVKAVAVRAKAVATVPPPGAQAAQPAVAPPLAARPLEPRALAASAGERRRRGHRRRGCRRCWWSRRGRVTGTRSPLITTMEEGSMCFPPPPFFEVPERLRFSSLRMKASAWFDPAQAINPPLFSPSSHRLPQIPGQARSLKRNPANPLPDNSSNGICTVLASAPILGKRRSLPLRSACRHRAASGRQ